jgi:hypothetical protein
MILDAAFDHYTKNCEDIRRCPNIDCKNLGIIPLKACQGNLECD